GNAGATVKAGAGTSVGGAADTGAGEATTTATGNGGTKTGVSAAGTASNATTQKGYRMLRSE
ncbi:hypothetical protein PF005_g13244, partial [Phytophthora fragariae]